MVKSKGAGSDQRILIIFRDNGYDLAMTENGLLIQTGDWGVMIRKDMVPSSIKSLIVLHSGDMPKMNTAVHVHKAECNDMILDAALSTMDALINEHTVSGGLTIKPTRLTMDSKRVWQLADTLSVRLMDLDNQQVMTLLLGERLDTRLVSGVIFCRHWAGTIYIRTEMILPEDRHLMDHLAEMQWIPVELESSIYLTGSDRGASHIMYLKTLDFAEGVNVAPQYVCSNQELLESIDLSNIETIGSDAFSQCKSLKAIETCENLTSIGSSAFNGCTSLQSFAEAPKLNTIGSSAFNGCTSLQSFEFAPNVTSIGMMAFNGCTALTSILLNPNLTDLGMMAFNGCTALTGEVIIPDAITTLPSSVFKETKFDRVVFPAGLQKIEYDAFGSCTHPTEFDFSKCTSIPSMDLGSYLGKTGNGQILKIPASLFDSWSTKSSWSGWVAQMVAV